MPTPPAPGRVPPQSLEAEMAVLGAVLLDNNAFSIAIESITHIAFYKKAHQDIFAAMEGLSGRGEAIDIVTLSEELKNRGTFHSVGAPAYLTTIMDQTHTAANVEHYANIVLQKFVLRRLITISNDIATQAFSGDREASARTSRTSKNCIRAAATSRGSRRHSRTWIRSPRGSRNRI
jgi:replicative DNA helicase